MAEKSGNIMKSDVRTAFTVVSNESQSSKFESKVVGDLCLENRTSDALSSEDSVKVLQPVNYEVLKTCNVAEQVNTVNRLHLGNEKEEEEEDEEEEKDDDDDDGLTAVLELPIPTPASLTDNETDSNKHSLDDQSDVVVTVKFRTDCGETMTSAFKIHSKIIEVKERLAKIFKLGLDDVALHFEGTECDDLVPLSGLGAEPLGTIELGIRSTDPETILAPGEFSCYIPVVDVITVRVPLDSGGFKDVVVEIENQCFVKEWLGGYRHRITRVEYHHAAIQTAPRKRLLDSLPQCSKNTQTPVFPFKVTAVNTSSCKATQVRLTDRYVSNVDDKIVATDPNRFKRKVNFTNIARLVAMILRVKRYVKKRLLKQEKLDLKCWENKNLSKEYRQQETVNVDKKLFSSPTFPLNRDDFYLLYLLVGKWWKREWAKIVYDKNNESRKAALLDLLQREIALISVIERQRIEAKKEILLKRDMYFLEASARPIVFRNDKGVVSSIDTLDTQQAREFKEIMASFLNRNVSKENRLDVICTLKNMLKKYDSFELTEEIVGLLERERLLLVSGLKDKELTGLRNRVKQLFDLLHKCIVKPCTMDFVKSKMPTTEKQLHLCLHCRKVKPVCDFVLHVESTLFSVCLSCAWMKNIGVERINLAPYAKILNQVRQSEMEKCCYSSICYVLQVVGMYYLTRVIWNGKSVWSLSQDINNLRMVRFRNNEDWSPWNCILLTLEESVVHLNIGNVKQFYSQQFLDGIHWRHLRAKNHFLPLIFNQKFMRENKFWIDNQNASEFTSKPDDSK